MKNLMIISSILLLGSRVSAGDVRNDDNAPATIEAALPAPVLSLSQWPDATILNGERRVDPGALEVASPKKQAWEWIHKVLDESWLPPPNTKMIFISKEFLDRDVARITWDRNGYHIEVAQTASVFTMKLVPQEADDTGDDSARRLEHARQLCRQVFNREGRMWSQDAQGAGRAVVVPVLNERIADFSFDPANVKQLSADNSVVGKARSMQDERIDSSALDEGALGVVAPNERSREAWHYWFRNVNWWNDGHAVGFYFLKVDGPGAWVPSWMGETDSNWFHGPRDRLGRPISAQQE